MTMSLYLSNIKKLDNVGAYRLQDSTLDISHYLSNLHIDYDEEDVPTIYDIPCSSVMELRGDKITISVPRIVISSLIDRYITDVDENTLLHHVGLMYVSHVAKSNKYLFDVLGYIEFMFSNNPELKKLKAVVKGVRAQYKETFSQDYEELKRLSNLKNYDLE